MGQVKSTDKEIRDTLILNGERVSTADMKRFWQERPDPDFDPKRNEDIIKRSIARAEELRKQKIKAKMEGLRERTSALASYVKYLDHGGGKTAEGYFGRKTMAELAGKKVMQILKERKANGQALWEVKSTQDKLNGYK
jgi:hypothetical protein